MTKLHAQFGGHTVKKISIVIPCYNEAGNIDKLIKALDKELIKKYRYEYLFINDGSDDDTLHMIQKHTKDKKVKYLDFSRNFGKEAAILAGLDYASGDAAIIIDADLEMPIRYINDMIKLWEDGNKLVLTYRKKRNKNLKSKLAQQYYKVFNRMSNTKILIDAMDFQLMDREVVDVITKFRERTRFFKGISGYIGYDYAVIPIEPGVRQQGVSKFSGYRTLFGYGLESLATYSDVPLKIAIKFGIFVAFLAVVFLVYTIVNTIVNGISVNGYASLMSVMLFMFAFMLLFLGIIGYYLALVYNEIKARPNYIVKDHKNISKGSHK